MGTSCTDAAQGLLQCMKKTECMKKGGGVVDCLKDQVAVSSCRVS